jgi:hypothetical protein
MLIGSPGSVYSVPVDGLLIPVPDVLEGNGNVAAQVKEEQEDNFQESGLFTYLLSTLSIITPCIE